MLVVEAVGDSVTVDEFAHLPAGVYYLRTGQFDLYNLSPPLLRELAALPVLAARPDGDFADFTTHPEHWGLGYEFMEKNRARYHALFVLGRLPMVGLAVALAGAVYACGTRHLGRRAGLAAAALAAFCPTVVAHGHLVGTDVGAALATFLAAWVGLETFRDPRPGRAFVLGVALGAALLTKFSALALVPTLALLAAVATPRARPRWAPFAALAGAAVVALAVVNVGYLGRGTGTPLAAHELQSARLAALARGAIGRLPLPLPADFVAGFDRQRAEASGVYPVYLHGQLSTTGWWYYYPAALGLKETLPMLALVAVGVVVAGRRARADPLLFAFLLVPPMLFAVLLTVATDIDLGVRYLLPVHPFLFLIAASPLAGEPARRTTIAAGLLVALHVVFSAAATPHHIAYMNALAGPADERWRWLADSNLDWGQELRRLRAYLERRGVANVHLYYFGRAAPEVYGVAYDVPHGPLRPGVYAVSASLLAGLPYFLWDHGTVYEAPAGMFDMFRAQRPSAVIGHSLFVYER